MAILDKETLHLRAEADTDFFYGAAIVRTDNVHIIGPSHSIWRDGILAWTAAYMAAIGSAGTLSVDEPQQETGGYTLYQYRQRTQYVGHIGGIGSKVGYEKGLRMLGDVGIPTHPISWNGSHSGLHHVELPDNSVQVVGDHCTSAATAWFMCRLMTEQDDVVRVKGQDFLRKAMAEEYRILSKGGRLMYQLDARNPMYAQILPDGRRTVRDLLVQAGFQPSHIHEHRVRDVVHIPITATQSEQAGKELREFIRHHMIEIKQGWEAPNLFVCVK
jgi:hypothetical protein